MAQVLKSIVTFVSLGMADRCSFTVQFFVTILYSSIFTSFPTAVCSWGEFGGVSTSLVPTAVNVHLSIATLSPKSMLKAHHPYSSINSRGAMYEVYLQVLL